MLCPQFEKNSSWIFQAKNFLFCPLLSFWGSSCFFSCGSISPPSKHTPCWIFDTSQPRVLDHVECSKALLLWKHLSKGLRPALRVESIFRLSPHSLLHAHTSSRPVQVSVSRYFLFLESILRKNSSSDSHHLYPHSRVSYDTLKTIRK